MSTSPKTAIWGTGRKWGGREIEGTEVPGVACSTGPTLMVAVYDYGYGCRCTGVFGLEKKVLYHISLKQHLDCYETPKQTAASITLTVVWVVLELLLGAESHFSLPKERNPSPHRLRWHCVTPSNYCMFTGKLKTSWGHDTGIPDRTCRFSFRSQVDTMKYLHSLCFLRYMYIYFYATIH